MLRLLQKEIENLKNHLLSLCARVEKSVAMAARSLDERDEDLAREVISNDMNTDEEEVEIEEECLKILALHQPVAIDLRMIISVLKINNDLERIGDLAVNIAERSVYLATRKQPSNTLDFAHMAESVMGMLNRSVDALVRWDIAAARAVCVADKTIDDMNRKVYEVVESLLRQGYEDVGSLINLLSISTSLERIADHATNIAEDVIYIISGEIVRHRESK